MTGICNLIILHEFLQDLLFIRYAYFWTAAMMTDVQIEDVGPTVGS